MTARVGLIIPSSNRMVEQEMVRAFPPGCGTCHAPAHDRRQSSRLRSAPAAHRGGDARARRCPLRRGRVPLHRELDGGRHGPAKSNILATLARAGAPRATTTITAIQRAFDALAARRIVLVTPYNAPTTEHEAEFLRVPVTTCSRRMALRSPAATPIARRRRSSGATASWKRRVPMPTPISSAARTSRSST